MSCCPFQGKAEGLIAAADSWSMPHATIWPWAVVCWCRSIHRSVWSQQFCKLGHPKRWPKMYIAARCSWRICEGFTSCMGDWVFNTVGNVGDDLYRLCLTNSTKLLTEKIVCWCKDQSYENCAKRYRNESEIFKIYFNRCRICRKQQRHLEDRTKVRNNHVSGTLIFNLCSNVYPHTTYSFASHN